MVRRTRPASLPAPRRVPADGREAFLGFLGIFRLVRSPRLLVLQPRQLLADGPAHEVVQLSTRDGGVRARPERRRRSGFLWPLLGKAEVLVDPPHVLRWRDGEEELQGIVPQLAGQTVDVPDLQLDPPAEQAAQVPLPQTQAPLDLPPRPPGFVDRLIEQLQELLHLEIIHREHGKKAYAGSINSPSVAHEDRQSA